MRKDTRSEFTSPAALPALRTVAGVVLTVLATEAGFLQRWLKTSALTGRKKWLICLGLAWLFAVAVEVERPGDGGRAAGM